MPGVLGGGPTSSVGCPPPCGMSWTSSLVITPLSEHEYTTDVGTCDGR